MYSCVLFDAFEVATRTGLKRSKTSTSSLTLYAFGVLPSEGRVEHKGFLDESDVINTGSQMGE